MKHAVVVKTRSDTHVVWTEEPGDDALCSWTDREREKVAPEICNFTSRDAYNAPTATGLCEDCWNIHEKQVAPIVGRAVLEA